MRNYLAIIALFTCAVLLWPNPRADAHKAPEVVAFPDLAPHMQFRVVQGTVKRGQTLKNCSLGRMDRPWADHNDAVAVLTCDGDLRLEMIGLYFDGTVNLIVEREK